VGRVLEHPARSMGLATPVTKRTVNLELGLTTPSTTTDTLNNSDDGDGFVTSLLDNDE
jgi:hypothetical protein